MHEVFYGVRGRKVFTAVTKQRRYKIRDLHEILFSICLGPGIRNRENYFLLVDGFYTDCF